jgi:hypothetical protein
MSIRFDGSKTALEECDIIFTDENNGVQIGSVPLYSRKGIKYISYDEIAQYYDIGKSVIIYNHHSMEKSDKFLERFARIKDRLGSVAPLFQAFVCAHFGQTKPFAHRKRYR